MRIRQNPEITRALRKTLRQHLYVSDISDTAVRTKPVFDAAVRIRPVRQKLRGLPSAMRRSALNVISFELNETINGRPLKELNLTNFDKLFREIRKRNGKAYTNEVQEKTKNEIRYEGLLFDNHIQILKIKNQLDRLGYLDNDGTADWNKSFTDAIKRFQSKNGLEVDGIPGLKTQEKLDEKIRRITLGLLPWRVNPHLGLLVQNPLLG